MHGKRRHIRHLTCQSVSGRFTKYACKPDSQGKVDGGQPKANEEKRPSPPHDTYRSCGPLKGKLHRGGERISLYEGVVSRQVTVRQLRKDLPRRTPHAGLRGPGERRGGQR